MVPALRYAIWAIIIIVPLLMLMQLSAWTQSSNYRLRSITLASANSPLISTPGGNLGINIPLMTIDTNTGHLQFPKSVKRIWFDVGAHERAMYTRSALDTQEDLAIIAFEPMYDKWGTLIAENGHERMIALPAAVSTTQGYLQFRRAGTDMCSSLSEVDKQANRKDWPGGCTETKYKILVPTLRLDTIVSKLPFDFVEFIKVDAQGNDFDVIKSLGDQLEKVFMIVIEIQINKPLYEGAPTLEEVTDWMEKRGFVREKAMLQGPNERNLLFRNTKIDASRVDLSLLPLKEIFRPNKWSEKEEPEGIEI